MGSLRAGIDFLDTQYFREMKECALAQLERYATDQSA